MSEDDITFLKALHGQVLKDMRATIRIVQQLSFDTEADAAEVENKIARVHAQLAEIGIKVNRMHYQVAELQRQADEMCERIHKMTMADGLLEELNKERCDG